MVPHDVATSMAMKLVAKVGVADSSAFHSREDARNPQGPAKACLSTRA
jgi:hypothetical protein